MVIPIAALISSSKGHELPAYAGLGGWALAMLSFFDPFGNDHTFDTIANALASIAIVVVVIYAIRLATPGSPWAQSRYSGDQVRRSVESYDPVEPGEM